jgi:glyoxylase-like metal-dependent hydrolase (beta-lactamase superfamily II)
MLKKHGALCALAFLIVASVASIHGEARALALLAEVKKVYPNKPLTQPVNTHHQFDHSGNASANP